MDMKNSPNLIRLFMTALICLAQTNLWAVTEINVAQSLLEIILGILQTYPLVLKA